MTNRILLCILFSFSITWGFSQTFDWWKNNVHWDGNTPWWNYLITSAKYYGPNALPVPEIGNGSIDSSISFSATGNLHFSNGDNTQNIKLYGNYCFKKNGISVELNWIPVEWYQMSHEKKTERKVYYEEYYKKNTVGDVIMNTNVQLLNRWQQFIKLLLTIGYRFPSGGGTGTARYTDAPGYWFNVSFGKPFKHSSWKWVGMAGFYVWQTNFDDYRRQDDAFVFGSGFEWMYGSFVIQSSIAGYLGYINNGDKPVVFRIFTEKKIKNNFLIARFQQGLHDFEYASFEFGLKYLIKPTPKN